MASLRMSARFDFALLLFAALLPLPPAQAQTLPDCPWPTSVTADATYTLTEDCKVTDTLEISTSTVTINGGGYSVDASSLTNSKAIINSVAGGILTVDSITFIGGGGGSDDGALQLREDSTTRQFSNASPSDCGLPLAGIVMSDAIYNLRSDCQMIGSLYILSGVTVTVNGRRSAINAIGSASIFITAGTLTIRDAILVGGAPLYGALRSTLHVEYSTLRNGTAPSLCRSKRYLQQCALRE